MIDAMTWDLSVMGDRFREHLDPEAAEDVRARMAKDQQWQDFLKTEDGVKHLEEKKIRDEGPWQFNPKDLRDSHEPVEPVIWVRPSD